jgi:hypothetical protein
VTFSIQAAIELFGDGDVRHGRGGRGAVPVLLAGRDADDVAGPDLLDRAPWTVISLMVCRYGTPLRKMSFCWLVPRLGTEPRLFENESSSEVRFSSRMLSRGGGGGGTGFGNGVGVTGAVGPEDGVEAVPDKISNKCGKWTKGRGRRGWVGHLMIGRDFPEIEITRQRDGSSGICVAHSSLYRRCRFGGIVAQAHQLPEPGEYTGLVGGSGRGEDH